MHLLHTYVSTSRSNAKIMAENRAENVENDIKRTKQYGKVFRANKTNVLFLSQKYGKSRKRGKHNKLYVGVYVTFTLQYRYEFY